MHEPPGLVVQAQSIAHSVGFEESCIDEVGWLLHILARQVQSGRIGEIGTGCGVGTAWMASALRPGVELYTVEIDPYRAKVARSLFRNLGSVRVLNGDWHRLMDFAPFQLLFADGGKAKEREPETVLAAVAVGGLVVLDDLTPPELWPPEWRERVDPVRDFWLQNESVVGRELRVRPDHCVILATRVR